MKTLRVGIIGSGMISHVHVKAFRAIPGVEIVGQHSRDPERGRAFCEANGIARRYDTLAELLAQKDVDVVTVALANFLHCDVALAAIKAGKHVIIEKPLTMTIAEADRVIEAAKKAGVVIGYAEELCYVPKFVRAKQLADAGAIGDVFLVKQSEKHDGPYSPWFFRAEEAGGGILMDMGCHAIEYCRWTLGKPPVKSVYCDLDIFLHKEQELDDHMMMVIEFEGGKKALVESSWTLKGGMESRAEIHGTKGVIQADLLQGGMGFRMFSDEGCGEIPGEFFGPGWQNVDWESLWQNGYPQEMADFLRCVREGGTPLETGEDGRVVLEIMTAGYLSAAEGRRIDFPFKDPGGYKAPVDLWLRSRR